MPSDWARPLAAFLDEPAFDHKYLQVSFDSADAAMVRTLRSTTALRTVVYNIVRLHQTALSLAADPI